MSVVLTNTLYHRPPARPILGSVKVTLSLGNRTGIQHK